MLCSARRGLLLSKCNYGGIQEHEREDIMADKTKVATLNLDGKEYSLPILSPSADRVIISHKLYAEAVFTYDPAFPTASCDSKITYIDGKGKLHQGYPIDQLAENPLLEVCYLPLN